MKGQKMRTIILVVLLIIIAACIYGIMKPSDSDKKEQPEQTKTEQQETTEVKEPETQSEAAAEEIKDGNKYDLNGVSIIYAESVRNDATGRWRMAKVTGTEQIENYAVDYYKKFFKADNEIHAVVNFSLETTSCVTYVAGKLNVRVYEHVDGEEHDAKALFGGQKLAEYNIDIETGEIETLE